MSHSRTAATLLLGLGLCSVTRGQSVVSLPTTHSAMAADIATAVTVRPADGVTSLDLAFDYNPAVVSPTGVYRTGYANAFSVSSDLTTPGIVRITMTSATPLAGSGDVCWVMFHILGTPTNFSSLAWVSARLNGGGIPSTTQDGELSSTTAQAIVSAPDDAKQQPGNQVVIPISAVPATGGDAFDITLHFNPAVISAVSVAKTPLSAPLTLTYNVGVPGEVKVSLFGTAPITGSGPLVNITFNVVGAIADKTPLDITRGDINERAISSNLDDGLFSVCDPVDRDGDGYSGCQNDCDDADPSIHPGATEICDGRDNNCNGTVDEGFDVGVACYSGVGGCQRSGHKVCDATHSATICDAIPGTPSPEVCNGIDDDCDGIVDNHIDPPLDRPRLQVTENGSTTTLSWTVATNTTRYDVQRGTLQSLLASGGDYSVATDRCLGDNLSGTQAQDQDRTGSTDGFWYLVRAENCAGNGTFDSSDTGQARSCDPGVRASPNHCP